MSEERSFLDNSGLEDLSPRDGQIVTLLLEGQPPKKIAAQVGCGVKVIYRLMDREDIKKLVAEYRRGMLRSLATSAQSHAEDALKVLADTAIDAEQPLGFRLRAAEKLICIAADLTSTVDDGERIDDLEKTVRELVDQPRAY